MLATLLMCYQQIRRDRGVQGILTLLDLSLLGQTNIGVRNLRGYLVLLCQTYVKTMKILCDSLSTCARTSFICFIFVSMRRGITACEIKYQLVRKPAVPGYLNTGGRRLARGVKEAGVHGRVAADPTIWGQKAK